MHNFNQEREQRNSAYSYNLSEPLSALKLHQHRLISGNQTVAIISFPCYYSKGNIC